MSVLIMVTIVTWIEIKAEIQISFTSFTKSGSVAKTKIFS